VEPACSTRIDLVSYTFCTTHLECVMASEQSALTLQKKHIICNYVLKFATQDELQSTSVQSALISSVLSLNWFPKYLTVSAWIHTQSAVYQDNAEFHMSIRHGNQLIFMGAWSYGLPGNGAAKEAALHGDLLSKLAWGRDASTWYVPGKTSGLMQRAMSYELWNHLCRCGSSAVLSAGDEVHCLASNESQLHEAQTFIASRSSTCLFTLSCTSYGFPCQVVIMSNVCFSSVAHYMAGSRWSL
jgi:hypothetical protein